MFKVRSLRGKEGQAKLKEIAEGSTCMFLTSLDDRPIPARPIVVQEICDQGNMWFFTSRESMKDQNLRFDPHVQLIFTANPSLDFLSVYGHATLVEDRKRKEELWNPLAKAWFTGGVEDPDLIVLKVTPEDIHYWVAKEG